METAQIQSVTDEDRSLAKKEWKTYLSVLKEKTPEPKQYRAQYKALKNANYYLSQGKSILDLQESMRIGGLNEEGLPKLAICCADFAEVTVNTNSWPHRTVRMQPQARNEFLRSTFQFPQSLFGPNLKITDKIFATTVPIIPARFLPSTSLREYYLLWETEKWAPLPPKDPLLLRRLAQNSNLFVVLAHWDLTPLERAVMRSATG